MKQMKNVHLVDSEGMKMQMSTFFLMMLFLSY